MGVTFGELGFWKDAVKAHQQAIRIKPDFAKAYIGMAVAQGGLGRYGKAIKTCRPAIQIKPDIAEVHYNLGALYLIQGDNRSASEERRILETMDPNLASRFLDLVASHHTLNIKTLATARQWISHGSSVTSHEIAVRREVRSSIDQLRSLVATKIMNQDVAERLVAELQKTVELLNRENTNAAVDLLHSFIQRVRALYVVGMLSPEEGQPLIRAAKDLIDQLHS